MTDQPEVGGGVDAPAPEGVEPDALNTPEAEAPEAEAPEVEYDDDGNPIDPPEEDAEELEFEGVKAKVPKSLAEAIRQGALRQADYTRKTQEVAAQRNEIAQQRASLDQEAAQRRQSIAQEEALVREHAAELVNLKTIASQLDDYEKLSLTDWDNIFAQDRDNGDSHWRRFQQLKDQRDRAISTVQSKAADLEQARKQASDQQAQQSQAYLAREIPNWGQDTFNKLGSIALEYGYQLQDVAEVMKTDPRAFKGLQEIASLRAQVAELQSALGKNKTAATAQAKTQASAAAAPVQPVGSKAPPTKARTTDATGDRLSTEAWMKLEEERERQTRRSRDGRFKAA